MRSALLCFGLAVNAFCAGGMFTFPLISPALAAYSKLSQSQLTTIILAGMMSQYPLCVVVGSLVDRHGAALCTLIGGILFALGFGMFSLQASYAVDNTYPSQITFYRYILSFLIIGFGTVFSYCSTLFAASKYFYSHIGLASGAVMTLFSLSPLFLSTIATKFFMASPSGMLDVVSFTAFLAIFTAFVSIMVFLIYRRYPIPITEPQTTQANRLNASLAEETTPLLHADSEHGYPITTEPVYPASIRELIRATDFWLLAIFCLFILGACEMVISNVGTISASLPPVPYTSRHSQSPSSSAALQVKLLSIANTLPRIIIGPLADFLSPAATYLPSGSWVFPSKHFISRFAFLSGAAALLLITCLWMEFKVHNQGHLWALSIGTGLCYSTSFTVIPSLISSLWGLQHLGRNFGLMVYAPFTGTPIFSYIYASISTSHKEADEVFCVGRTCWQTTFAICSITSMVALVISFVLWKRWQGKI